MASVKPCVNLFDIPELMPGAQPSANPAQRENFEQRCRELYVEETEERQAEAEEALAAAGAGLAAACTDFEVMFPNLDPPLIRALCEEAPAKRSVIDTLLALAGAVAEPHAVGDDAAAPVLAALHSVDVGLEDHEKFPTLVDAGGWQVGSQRQFELADKLARGEEEQLGSAWRDQARVTAGIPLPRAKAAGAGKAALTLGRRQVRKKEGDGKEEEEEHGASAALPMTDYELRQHAGHRRGRQLARFGRRGGRRDVGGRSGGGSSKGRGAAVAACSGSGSESEASDEEVGAKGLAA